MADRGGSFPLPPRLDFQQLMVEAQHRWLRPAEICEILRNYQKFQITPEPPNRPTSGSLFLFDRKVLRYFRKDGHNWRKKKDGKTVREAHEKLKVGSVDVLHCYYAHGEGNETFQRRSYWSLEPDLTHIVFVHYLEVKNNKTNIGGIGVAGEVKSSHDYYSSPRLCRNPNKTNSGNTDSASPTSTLTSLCEDADSGNHDELSSFTGVQQITHVQVDSCKEVEFQRKVNTVFWGDTLQQCQADLQTTPPQLSKSSPEVTIGDQEQVDSSTKWQASFEDNTLRLANFTGAVTINSEFTYALDPEFIEERTPHSGSQSNQDILYTFDEKIGQSELGFADPQCVGNMNAENGFSLEGADSYAISSRKLFLGQEGLQKNDSFSRWIAKELDDVEDFHVQSTSDNLWTAVECGNVSEESSLSPSISQDQLFSVIDYSPKWAYKDLETEVLIVGTFLKSQSEVAICNWSCMFGEVEVPAQVLADGVLCCRVPCHRGGQVPFYITCSNRLACSEVREFEYLEESAKDVDVAAIHSGDGNELLLCSQLQRLLSLGSSSPQPQAFEDSLEIRDSIIKIISLKDEEDTCQTLDPYLENESAECYSKFQLLQKLMKEKYYSWLLHKITEGGKGPSILDSQGQGAIHLAAALGYDWAIKPSITAGVSINFRDVNGWTALHWAACCGREQTVAVLISLGAATGALTDPSPAHPLGRTPADLASGNGHKGISGFLAETSLTSYLSSLTMKDPNEGPSTGDSSLHSVQTITEKVATPLSDSDVPEVLSLKDSLSAVCNAKQAAARIHQVFRMQSFQRKQVEYESDGSLDEHALSILAAKISKPGQQDWLAHAATKIQKKFRGWKKRKEFLIIRQRIIKIQAHVRGHQVRKQYKTIVWSVGILEKIILRWRRKGRGLRGFRQENKEQKQQGITSKEDDYDFLKEGRKQTEERLQKALTRVTSMVQYPGGRDQYRRLLTVVEGIREPKVSDMVLSSSNEASNGEDVMIDIESLMDDDAFMSATFD